MKGNRWLGVFLIKSFWTGALGFVIKCGLVLLFARIIVGHMSSYNIELSWIEPVAWFGMYASANLLTYRIFGEKRWRSAHG